MSLLFSLALLALLALLPHQTRAFVLEGSRTSYAQFPPWEGGAHSWLSVEFRTSLPSGLLLYSDSDLANTCDFLHLTLVQGRVRLRFNSGQGAQVLSVTSSSSKPSQGFSDGQWHTVRITRAGPNTSLTVDNNEDSVTCQEEDQEEDQTRISGGDASTNHYVYLGGLPSWFSNKLKVGRIEISRAGKGLLFFLPLDKHRIYLGLVLPLKLGRNFVKLSQPAQAARP